MDETLSPRPPEDGLEAALVAGVAGTGGVQEMLDALIEAPVIVLVTEGEDGPVPFTVTRADGAPLLPVFTALDHVHGFLRAAPYAPTDPRARTISGRDAVAGLQPGAGLVINLGAGASAEVPAEDVARILERAEPATVPRNHAVERAAKDVRLGFLDPRVLVGEMLRSRLYVLTPDPREGGLRPLFLENDGRRAVAVFSRLDFATPYAQPEGHALAVPTADLVRGMDAEFALLLDAGQEWAFLVEPAQLAPVREALAQPGPAGPA